MIDPAIVLAMVLSVAPAKAPWSGTYNATAQAIADAADTTEEAAILVSLARFESSLNPAAVGDCRGKEKTLRNCQSLGLFQVSKHHASAMCLLIPDCAARHAVRLVRESMRICGPGPNQLAWYATGGPSCRSNIKASAHRMFLARRLLRLVPQGPSRPSDTSTGQPVASSP